MPLCVRDVACAQALNITSTKEARLSQLHTPSIILPTASNLQCKKGWLAWGKDFCQENVEKAGTPFPWSPTEGNSTWAWTLNNAYNKVKSNVNLTRVYLLVPNHSTWPTECKIKWICQRKDTTQIRYPTCNRREDLIILSSARILKQDHNNGKPRKEIQIVYYFKYCKWNESKQITDY